MRGRAVAGESRPQVRHDDKQTKSADEPAALRASTAVVQRAQPTQSLAV